MARTLTQRRAQSPSCHVAPPAVRAIVAVSFMLLYRPGQCSRWGPTRQPLQRGYQVSHIEEAVRLTSLHGPPQHRSTLDLPSGDTDCSSDYLFSPKCPEVRALLAFKSANVDPFGALASWIMPCSLSLNGQPSQGTPAAGASDPGSAVFPQCAYICQNWEGVTCNSNNRVMNVTVSNPSPKLLWGNFSIGQSIPPEFGDLLDLEYLKLANNKDSQSYLGGLIGPLPESLTKLSQLTYLNLQYNYFWGQLPDQFGQLASLAYLSLTSNNLTGPVPTSFGLMEKLTYLDLSFNKGLNQSIPSELGNLKNLSYLALASTSFSGSIPSAMSGLTSLTWLDLHSAKLSGPVPPWIGSLSRLYVLGLNDNKLTGTLPAALGTLPALSTLTLASNNISGSFPDDLATGLCKGSPLFTLDLSFNQITGPLPPSLRGCTALGQLQLNKNRFSGDFPGASFFTSLKTLSSMDLSGNQLTGTVPNNLMALVPTLIGVYIQSNRLNGPMPQIYCQKQQLTVNFSGNAFTGSLSEVLGTPGLATCMQPGGDGTPPSLANMTLDFSYNQLSGPLDGSLLSMETLYDIKLDANLLSGPLQLPPGFTCAKNLNRLSAAGNNLTGTIPTGLGTCKGLQVLDLSGNSLVGPIPRELKAIGNSLQSLQLQDNQLTGGVPPEIDFFQQLFSLNLSGNVLTNPLPSSICNLPNLAQLDLSGNGMGGELPPDLGNLTVARGIRLERNNLTGPIPVTIAPPNLPLLKTLDLSENQLTGIIPPGFSNSTPANVTLDFSHNNLNGTIPGGEASTFANTFSAEVVDGNPNLCGGLGYPPCPDPSSGSLSTGAIVGIVVGAVAALILILGIMVCCLRKRSRWAGGTMMMFEKLDFHLTIEHILEATEDFNDKYKLGKGGFGTVYRATLQDGRTVAIKRLGAKSAQGDREFQAEMRTLGNIRHRNLVVLVAAYVAPPPSGERLIIYNFLSGGSLDTILNNSRELSKDSPYRQWALRCRIALDVARGLKYLHHDCVPRIIHRDMKPANVLMDDQLVAHVADFGLAREVDGDKTHMLTAVFGTIGYLAPEYTQRGKLTFKSDVFSYGVLLLQLITGKQPTDRDVAERGLARYVGGSSAASVIDSRMEIEHHMNQILGAIKLGLLCTSRVAADRPSMAEVVYLLENLEDFAKGIVVSGESSQSSMSSRGLGSRQSSDNSPLSF